MATNDKLAILVGGGPAPGINGVIGAATITARLAGVPVLGLLDGYKWLLEGDTSRVHPLELEETTRLHFRGGSTLGISRANPTKKAEHLDRCLATLKEHGVGMLVSIGGDDTCFSASKLAAASRGALRVVHVPKTIDNDLDLPRGTPTFGFETARHLGVEIVENLMVDARTTGRWYFVVAMGRKAGHLALGIGKAAGATVTLVPEEFTAGVRLQTIVDELVCSIVKRHADGHPDGVAVLAEGLVEFLAEDEVEGLAAVERDEHGHIRIAEVDLGAIVKQKVQAELAKLGLKPTIVAKNIGYELRCADPIPYDMEYTRDLGYCAARYLLEGGDQALVSMQQGEFVPLPFKSIMDPATGRMRVRMVDVSSPTYRIARAFMLRLRRADLADEASLARLAASTKLPPAAFADRFGYLVKDEPAPMSLQPSSR